MNELHITLYQHSILWGEAEANRQQVEARMAASGRSDIFVVPETFTTGFGNHMAALAEEPEGPTLQWARRMASRHQTLFVGTWVVREGDNCFNRLHWVYPDGNSGHYDKAHTFRVSGEADQISRGHRRVTFEWRGWRIRPAVCYDLRFPTWLRNAPGGSNAGDMDYDLLLVCANWPASRREAWSTLLRARAIENLCYTAGCNRTGVDDNGGLYSGDSTVVDCKGFPVAGADSNQLVTAVLDLDRLHSFRERWPFYLDFDQDL